MASKKLTEPELVKIVFGNDKGQQLLDLWYDIYMNRPSYNPKGKLEDCIYFEGQRSMVLSIKQLLELKNDR